MRKVLLAGALCASVSLAAQTQPPRPRPFPGTSGPATTTTQQPPRTGTPPASAIDPQLGVPMFPGAVQLGRYEANAAQPFFVYGSGAAYLEVVEFYKAALKNKGRALFGGPMHQFDVGRYRKETMVLQPGVTVKDFTWNGREGYLHVTGRQTVKYPTVIQVVPAPPER